MVCGLACGADPGGRYFGYYDGKYNKNDTITIKKSGADEYSVEVMLVQGMFSCGFTGKGKLAGGTIRVVNGVYTLPVHVRPGNMLELLSEENEGLRKEFCGAGGAVEFGGTFKKK